MTTQRTASIQRATSETAIDLSINLDGQGTSTLTTGVGFFEHMLTQIARHGLVDLTINASGDLHIDDHHTVEDVGIVLGMALREALGDKSGIARYGDATVPMDEALVLCALDFSGRGQAYIDLDIRDSRIGTFATELVEEFFHAVARNARMTLHIRSLAGKNAHHVVEGAFKAFGRALRMAIANDPRVLGIPSTKGSL
ncbi:MAG: imidazoleglycerol-phosphate dehydratase HisB [Armatimonadaceae bacterium]